MKNDILYGQSKILYAALLFIGFSSRPSHQSITSNRLPELAIDCFSSTHVFLHPLELRVGPPRFFIVGSDQSLTTTNKLFDN